MSASANKSWYFAAGAVLAATATLSLFSIESEDLPMYLAIARLMVQSGGLPVHDPFLFTISNYEWYIAHQWLSYLVFYGLYAAGGWALIVWFKTALVCAMPGAVLWGSARQSRRPLTFVLIALALTASAWRFVERSALFSDIFTVLTLLLLLENRARPTRAVFVLPAVFLLWVNLHPGFPVGLFFCGAFLIFHFDRRLAFATALSAASCLINPKGFWGAVYPLIFANREAEIFQRYYTEWWPAYRAPFVTSEVAVAFLILGLMVVYLLCRKSARIWADLVIAAALIFMAVKAIRFFPMASFSLALLGTYAAGAKREERPRLQRAAALTFASAALIILLTGYSTLGLKRRLGFELDRRSFPIGNAELIDQLPADWHMFNNHDYGGYLAWRWDGRRKVYFHGFVTDTDFYVNEFTRAARSPQDLQDLIRKYDLKIILVDRAEGYPVFGNLLKDNPEWKLTGADEASVLWVREPAGK